MGEFDTDYKLFYKPILDFGSGVGINESMEKYNLEEMNRRNREEFEMDNIGMSDDGNLQFLQNFLIAKGYNKLIPKSLQDKYLHQVLKLLYQLYLVEPSQLDLLMMVL